MLRPNNPSPPSLQGFAFVSFGGEEAVQACGDIPGPEASAPTQKTEFRMVQ